MKFRLRSVLILLACAHLMTACTDPSASQNSDASDTTGVDADQSLDPDTAGPDTAGPDTSRPDTSGPDTSRPDVGAVDASTNPDATTNADVGPTDPTGSAVTQVSTVNPATFGMVFAQGDVPETVVLMAGDQPRQAQIDRLATWPDGSLKHARITVLEPGTFNLVTTDTTSSSTPPEMPDIDFEAQVQIDGTSWTAGLAAPSETTGGPLFAQYDLPAVTLTNAQGDEHPYLALKAWVWFYPTTGQTEVIATIENAWAQTSDDRVVTDQVAYRLDGDEVFSEDDVTIGQWTRTRAMRFWEGDPVSRHAD